MNSKSFLVSNTANVLIASYSVKEERPFVLDISIEGTDSEGDTIDYSEVSKYSDEGSRDCDFACFDKEKADKFFAKAMKRINA